MGWSETKNSDTLSRSQAAFGALQSGVAATQGEASAGVTSLTNALEERNEEDVYDH